VTLEKIIDEAYVRFRKASGPDHAVRFVDFLEERGITMKEKEGWPKAFKTFSLYIPPELAKRMLVLGYLP
jgi:hypothetical protein